MSAWDYETYTVTAELSWMLGITCCSATITMTVSAKSVGHAISRAKDELARIGTHKVNDMSAEKEPPHVAQ